MIKSLIQFVYDLCLRLFFHFECIPLCISCVLFFNCQKTKLLLFILNLSFAANFEAECFLIIASGLLHVLMV